MHMWTHHKTADPVWLHECRHMNHQRQKWYYWLLQYVICFLSLCFYLVQPTKISSPSLVTVQWLKA